jgi:hypothetical protein
MAFWKKLLGLEEPSYPLSKNYEDQKETELPKFDEKKKGVVPSKPKKTTKTKKTKKVTRKRK